MYFYIYSMSFLQSVMWLFSFAFIWTGLKIIFFHLNASRFPWRIFSAVLLLLWLGVTLKITVFSRTTASYPVCLLPFHQLITVLSGGNPETMRSFWMNILLFTPYGIIFPEWLPNTFSSHRSALVTFLSAGLFSVTVEICQWYWRLGVAETDDVMANLLGTGIGFAAFLLGQSWFRRLEHRQEEESSQRRYFILTQYQNAVPTTETGIRPPDGISHSGPFSPSSGSKRFRIPALVTMDDGTVTAAADARWNTGADGCGLDTIVSFSEDNGTSWRYTFANYLGDNGNRMNRYSTAFIDPLLTVRGDTIYLLVDLWPGGVALNSSVYRPVAGTGFNAAGKLLLKSYNTDTYDYYLGDFDDTGTAKICGNDGNAVPGYTVDRWFNLYYHEKTINSNLFYFTAPYRVCPTSYLYLTTSTDKGKTWSAPLMLNPMVKNSHEPFYGTGPGRGLVTKSGLLLFPCYYYINGIQGTSFIYSSDGKNWKRTPTLSDASSESQLVELSGTAESAGKIRCFFRNKFGKICYADAYPNTKPGADGDFTWGDITKTDIILHGHSSDCQIAALRYSKKIDGCDVILISCPNNHGEKTDSGRYNGFIHTMLYHPKTGTTTWAHSLEVNGKDDFFAYSCLTELQDGSIALLYESESDVNFTWKTFRIDELL